MKLFRTSLFLKSRRAVALTLVATFTTMVVAGCGSSNDDFVRTGGGEVTPRSSISGKVFLGREIPDATVQLVAPDGTVLASTRTGPSGQFLIPEVSAPENFRVNATVADSQLTFSTEVRDYAGDGRYVVVNVPTTMVSRLARGQSGEGLAAAEARVRSVLGFPADRSLEYGVEEAARMPFSHLAFFHEAAAHGGVESYLAEVLSGEPSARAAEPRFRLTRQVARRSLGALDPRVRPYFQEFLARRSTQLDLVSHDANPGPGMGALLDGLRVVEGGGELVGDGDASLELTGVRGRLLTTIVKYTAESVGTQVQKQLVADGWTHIADSLNLNYGTTRMLEVIQDQLNEVLGMLAALDQQINELELQTATDDLNPSVSKIQELTQALANANSGPDGIGGTPGVVAGNTVGGSDLDRPETPYSPPQDVVTLLSSLATFTTVVSLADIQDEMLGTNGALNVLTINRDNIYSALGATPTQSNGKAPLRSKLIIDKLLSTSEYYNQIQQNACTVLGELAHVTDPNPLADMTSAARIISDAAVSLKKQRGQLPQYLMSDEIIVDLDAGLMWYRQVQDATNYDTAESNGGKFQLDVGYGVTYKDWRIATNTEVAFLHDRARTVDVSLRDGSVVADGDEDNSGFSAQGLAGLGFTNLSAFVDEDATVWSQYYYYDDLNGWFSRGLDLYFNHKDVKPSEFDQADTDEEYPYFLVRSIGEPVVLPSDDAPAGNYPRDFEYSNPSAAEFSTLGHLTGIGSVSVVDGKAGATVTFDIDTGGSVAMSGNGDTASYDLPTRHYTHLVDSYPGYFNDYAGPVDLDELIYYVPATSTVSVGWEGDLYWHTDTALSNYGFSMTGYVMNTAGSLLSSTGGGNVSAPARTLTDIQIWPRNKKYDATISQVITDNFYCLAYYSDNTVADVTGSTTWGITDPQGNPSNAASIGNVSSGGTEVVIDTQQLDAVGQVQLTAAFGGKADSSSAGVFDDSLPVITGISPVSAAVGQGVTLTGNDFLGVTGVTFGGTAAQFVVNTDSQISVRVPAGSGTVDVVLFNSEGQSRPATFTYQ